jgi:hypothetical protein
MAEDPEAAGTATGSLGVCLPARNALTLPLHLINTQVEFCVQGIPLP